MGFIYRRKSSRCLNRNQRVGKEKIIFINVTQSGVGKGVFPETIQGAMCVVGGRIVRDG